MAALDDSPLNSAAVEVSKRVGRQLTEGRAWEELGRKALTSQHKESDSVVVFKFETLLVGDFLSFVGSHDVDRSTLWQQALKTGKNTSKIVAHYA